LANRVFLTLALPDPHAGEQTLNPDPDPDPDLDLKPTVTLGSSGPL